MTLAPSLSRPALSGAFDSRLQGALAELLELGLIVARVMARLAEAEGRAVEALAEAAVQAARDVVAMPRSYADAIEAGQRADGSDLARDLIAARMVSITESFDKAARAVRRTAALQARLAAGRGFGDGFSGSSQAGGAPRGARGLAGRAANDAERAERGDAPEWGDEIGGRSDEEVLRAIRRDLGLAAAGVGVGEGGVGPVLPETVSVDVAQPLAVVPPIVDVEAQPGGWTGVLPEPDT